MVEMVGIRIYAALKVGAFYHGEKEALRNQSQNVVYGQGLRPAAERGSLVFDPRRVKFRDGAFAESGVVRQQNIGIRSHAVHLYLGVEKLEGGV